MKILFFVLVVCALLLREAVVFAVWLLRKMLSEIGENGGENKERYFYEGNYGRFENGTSKRKANL